MKRIALRIGNFHVICRPSMEDTLESIYTSNRTVYDWLMASGSARILRGRAPVLVGPVGTEEIVVKHHVHGGLLAPITCDRFVSSARIISGMHAGDYLINHGIATPDWLFISWWRQGPWIRCESGVTFVAQGVDAADRFFGKADRSGASGVLATARRIGALVRHLHDIDFLHADANLMNFLCRDSGEIVLLDLDKCRVPSGPLPEIRKRWNLKRLFRSIRKQGIAHPVDLTESILSSVREGYRERPCQE
ncbi:hypothetical protein JXA80_01910 [bacterium]|nr:hypothetical protein [candidate division CSSED10-310 bacterium]